MGNERLSGVMPRHWRIRYAGAQYHVTARGNGREEIFLCDDDRERFLEQLKEAMEADEVVLYAYVLMPNHYHLLVETPLGNIQKFMQRLNTAYGMYFRFKHSRVGHCFQGRYGAKLVKGDEYVLRVARYIHLNPVKIKRYEKSGPGEKRQELRRYRWSSYRGYAGLGPKEELVDYKCLRMMGRLTEKRAQAAYREYVEGMVSGEDDLLKEARARSGYVVGDEDAVEETESKIRAAKFSKVDRGDIVWPEKAKKGLEEVVGAALKVVGLRVEELGEHGRRVGDRKSYLVELLCRYSSASQREIAGRLGYKCDQSVGKQRQLLRRKMKEDRSYAKTFEKLSRRMGDQ